jgi:hypothetical protein
MDIRAADGATIVTINDGASQSTCVLIEGRERLIGLYTILEYSSFDNESES